VVNPKIHNPSSFAERVKNLDSNQASSQDCQNEEADKSTSPPLPYPPLEVGPLNPARGSEGALILVHFNVKIRHLVATVSMTFLRIN